LASIAYHMTGDRAAAMLRLDSARSTGGNPDEFAPRIAVLQATALIGLFEGDLDAVRSASTEGIRRSQQAGDLYALEMMLLNLGLAALIRGDLTESGRLFVEALRIARRIDDRVAQYLLLDALGCQAAGCGQTRLAARLLGAGQAVQTGVGATVFPYLTEPVSRATESTREALGTSAFEAAFEAGERLDRGDAIRLALGEPARVSAAPPSEASPLGKREGQVAQLVAGGLSNKEIGARLFISEHTVDSHLRNIMNKLGVNSRAEIAAWTTSSRE
jgi:DNA-binding CsgD family transcriptional regulator